MRWYYDSSGGSACTIINNLRSEFSNCLFLNNAEECFGLMCLVHVAMGVFTICDSMLLVVLTDWYPPYCFMMVGFLELTIYFLIGHIAEVKIDEMYDTIISMPWYKLPVLHQKEFNLFLCRQQRPMMLTAYGFHPLNFEAYMSVRIAIGKLSTSHGFILNHFSTGLEGTLSVLYYDDAMP
uniref:Odorant receptor n=1 Tax=Anopheles dirus TaxID=7168 RepID=A0A182NZ75_9DIPT